MVCLLTLIMTETRQTMKWNPQTSFSKRFDGNLYKHRSMNVDVAVKASLELV